MQKIGGEYRIGNLSLRAGLSYYQDPVSLDFKKRNNDNVNRTGVAQSLGIGYRTNEFYIDVTGSRLLSRQAYTPYSLSNSQDYASSVIEGTSIKGLVSFGIFF
jgi:hypothetical protein